MTTSPITPELIAECRALNPPDPNMPPCPPWCTLEVGHTWDSVLDGGRQSRGHQGPSFGEYVSVGSREFADAIGEHKLEIDVHEGVDGNIDSPADALAFAADVVAAAQWVAGKNAFDLGRDYERGRIKGLTERLERLEAQVDGLGTPQ